MRRIAILAVLLLTPVKVWAVPTLAWKLAAISTVSSTTVSPAIPSGNSAAVGDELLVFMCLGSQSATITPPSSPGVTWSTSAASCSNTGGSEEVCVFTGRVGSTQATGTSYSFTSSAAISMNDMWDVSGTNGVVDYVHGAQGTGGGTSLTLSPTLSVPGDFVAGFIFNFNSVNFGTIGYSGWTGTPTLGNSVFVGGMGGGANFYNIQTAAGSPSLGVNWTNTTWADDIVIALQPALSFANDDNAHAPLYYLPITLTNNQGSPVASGTEVCIGSAPSNLGCGTGFNPAPYTQYINTSASNVNFQDGAGNLLNSWIETPGASTNGPILWWVKLNNSIPANSSLTIYMVMVALGSNSMNSTPNHTGAGPLYTTTYGQYDNGGNVFASQYQDFKGTSTPTGWSLTQSTPTSDFTINNGVWIYHPCSSSTTPAQCSPNTTNGTVFANTGLTTSTTPAIQNVIAEWYAGGTPGENQQPVFVGTADSAGNIGGGAAAAIDYEHTQLTDRVEATLGLLVLPTQALAATPNTQFPYPLFVGSVYTTAPNTAANTGVAWSYGALDYPSGAAATGTTRYLSINESNEVCCTAYVPFVGYWTRWRSYPPNGVQPTASFGQLLTVSSSAPPSVIPNLGLVMTGKAFIKSPIANPVAPVVRMIASGSVLQWNNAGQYFTSLPFAPTAGDTVVVAISMPTGGSPPTPAVTITTPGYSWTATTGTSGGMCLQFFYAFNVPGGTTTFTTNTNYGQTSFNGPIAGYVVLDVGNPLTALDQNVGASGGANVAATTTVANEVAIAATAVVGTGIGTSATPEPGFTLLPSVPLGASWTAYQPMLLYVTYEANTGAAGSITGGIVSGNSPSVNMLTFKTSQPLLPVVGGALVTP